MQVGKFIVGQPEGSDDVIGEEAVPVGQRFPALLKGQGVRGHRYHVFDKPRYVSFFPSSVLHQLQMIQPIAGWS